jgi:putative redox protein
MIRSERVEFPGAGGDLLAGRLDRPMGRPRAYGLFAHCFTCSKDVFAAQRISTSLAERGVAILRFDFTGPNSAGTCQYHLLLNVADLAVAAIPASHTQAQATRRSFAWRGRSAGAIRIPECACRDTNAPFDRSMSNIFQVVQKIHSGRGSRDLAERVSATRFRR